MRQLKCDNCPKTTAIPEGNRDRALYGENAPPPGWMRLMFIHRSAELETDRLRTAGEIALDPELGPVEHAITRRAQDYCPVCTAPIMAALAGALKSGSRIVSPDAC